MKRLGILVPAVLLTSCFTSPTEDGPTDIFAQEPYVQALLDANGLKDIPLGEVVKVLNPNDPHGQNWYIDLNGRGIQSFHFRPDVKKLTLFVVIDLQNNEMTSLPGGLPSVPGQNVGLDNLKRMEGGGDEMSWVVVASMPTEKRSLPV